MIAKCIFVLAVVAQTYALPCKTSCQETPVVVASSGCGCGSAVSTGSVIASGSVVASSGSASGPAEVKNVVAKGKYPVALKNCGPTPDKQIPVTTTRVNAPAKVKPTVRLPCSVPAPRCVSHTCTCYKTVLRPRVNQQIISVPTIERYIETSHKPIIENIQYEAIPVNCGDESSSGYQIVDVSSGASGLGCAPVVGVSQAQAVSVPQVQTVQIPQVQTCVAPQIQTISVPQVQTVPVPQVQTCVAPQIQTISVPQVQTCGVPQTVSLCSSCNSC